MRNVTFLVGLALFALVAAPAHAQQAGAALVIANANYPDEGRPLPHVAEDAKAVADEFKRMNFDVELKSNLGKEDLHKALDAFVGKITKGSAAIVYFSGFGLQVARQTYLIPVDGRIWSEPDVRREGVSIDQLLTDMQRKGADVKIVILDAARRNPFERRIRATAAGLAPVDAPVGTLVLYSAALGKLVHDRGSGAHSLFAAELLKELRKPNISAETAFNRARVGVSRASKGEQVPWVASSMLGEYPLGGKAPNVPAATSSVAPPPPDESDRKPAVASLAQFPAAQAKGQQRKDGRADSADTIKPQRMTVDVKVGEQSDNRGLLGVNVTGLTDDLAKTLGLENAHGAFVTTVTAGGPAAQAGIAPTDVVVDFDGRKITEPQELSVFVGQTPPGSKARTTILRLANSTRDLADPLQRRAQNGDDDAAFTLAWLNMSEYGGLKNDAEAARWARKASQDGHAGATYLLGLLYSRGHGVAKDEAEAVKLFREAADKNDVNGMFALASAYASGKGIGKDVAQARRWFQRAAEAGYAPAMAAVGEMYANGVGAPKDGATAVDWYRKAAEKNNPVAIAGLGWMYESGNGVTQDYGQAQRWYRKATEFNHPGAFYRLGAMAEAGHGGPKDYILAAKWYRQAVARDHTFAMIALGLLYEAGRGVDRDPKEALRLFKQAGEKGNGAGLFYAGFYYERSKDYAQAVDFYSQAARMGDTAAMHNLGVAYDRGRGVGENRRTAADWIFKAVKAGSAFSVKQMTDNAGAYSVDLRRNLQRMLKDAGVYDGPINGRATAAFKEAVETLGKRSKSG
jgi:TPR repeat protein